MKTYLLNIPNELRRYSQKLDAQAILCNKTWEVFNDEGQKQVFIFQNDGRLLISNNGNVTISTWQYIASNNSIIITVEGQTTMLRPAFIDGIIFAMQKDGTQECLFLIDEQKSGICPHRTLTELKLYFEKKQEESPEYIEARQQEQRRKELEQQQKELEQKKKEQDRLESIVKEHQDEIDAITNQYKTKYKKGIAIAGIIFVILTVIIIMFRDKAVLGSILLIIDILAYVLAFSFTSKLMSAKKDAEDEVITKYK